MSKSSPAQKWVEQTLQRACQKMPVQRKRTNEKVCVSASVKNIQTPNLSVFSDPIFFTDTNKSVEIGTSKQTLQEFIKASNIGWALT